MRHRLILAGFAATGGLLTSAFLQVAVAAADVSADGADAFTLGGFTFDPFTVGSTGADVEGFASIGTLSSGPPLLELGGGDPVIALGQQSFEVFDPSTGADLGTSATNVTVTSLLGLTNTEFTVTGFPAADLPSSGSVYDAFNLGNGYENVYTAIPGTAGGSDTVTDTLVTPFGNVNLDSLFGSIDAAARLQPGDAITGIETADISGAPDAFTIGNFTFDAIGANGVGGFSPTNSIESAPPLLNLGGGVAFGSINLDTQQFDVFSGTGSSATEVGTISTGVDVTNLLGLTNTQFTVDSITPATGDSAADLPTVGSVYDAFNLGNGYTNVYSAIPGTAGGSDTVTDTLVTPNGNVNLDSLFGSIDAAAPLQPGDAFTGLAAGDSSIGADAFSIGDTTFDPTLTAGGTEGFIPVDNLIGAAPLLDIGGGTLSLGGSTLQAFTPQDFNVFDGTGASATEVGSITGNEDVTNLLGLTNTEFTVANVIPDADASASDLPTVGSVFDAMNLGGGIENVYTAIPGVAGAADTVTDTLVTPFGNINLDSLFGGIDAAALLNPGDAFNAGLDVATSAATEAATSAASAIDPLAFLGL
jgi:hypothetical protein